MPNQLQPHYNDFGGLDTRSNEVMSDPRTLRGGSRNFRYNFKDEIQQANGFQHKDNGSAGTILGLAEYKYKDINTGQSKTQILAVNSLGELWRKKADYLQVFYAVGNSRGSYYYDEVDNTFRLVFNPGNHVVDVSLAATLDDIKADINALAVVGLTADVVDQDGTPISSSKLAYLMDVIIDFDMQGPAFNGSSWYWEKVYFGDPSGVPFKASSISNALPGYEGISFTNLNNAIYITDGGFLMKYDGYSVYRAGMPEVKPVSSGFAGTPATNASGALTAGVYKYLAQLCFVDPNGAITEGRVQLENFITATLTGLQNTVNLKLPSIYALNAYKDFPVYSCQVNGNQNITGSGANLLNVVAGHNIVAGMTLRVPISNSPTGFGGLSFAQMLVTTVTATTITVDTPSATMTYPYDLTILFTLANGEILNAGYVDSYQNDKVTDIDASNLITPPVHFGAFIRLYRTKVNGTTFYRHYDLALNNQSFYNFNDFVPDSDLVISLDANSGEALPRAGNYISQWQGQLVQAGRPANLSVGIEYPTVTTPIPGNSWGLASTEQRDFYYTEAFMCDFQSFYWADPSYPEGFPQSGLFEDSLDTKFNDQVTGISPNKDAFFLFKQRSTGIFTGVLATQQINKELLEADVGCSAHRSIQEVRGGLIWLDGVNGFYFCVAGRLPVPVGFAVSDTQKMNPLKIDFKKAVSCNFRIENMYVCCIEDQTFVYDYSETENGKIRNCWYLWDRFATSDMIATADDEMILISGGLAWKFKRTNTKYDMTDHTSAIVFDARTAWINFNRPSIDKSYIGGWINSVQGDFSLDVQMYSNYLDPESSSITIAFPEQSTKKTVKEEFRVNTSKLSAVSIGMRNAEKNKFVRIQGWDLQFAADFDAGEPKK